jgi:uncharacterized protein YgbK (DUF1537 family)
MIVAVIADDLSGAAELAGAAAEMGFSAEVHTRFDSSSDAEIIAIDADTRGLSADAAAKLTGNIISQVTGARPEWIFKKTDSVLRGNVKAEITAILKAATLRRALLVPANPSKGRIIRNGVYLVGGVPLEHTSFALDPHHPRSTSNVIELLHAQKELMVESGLAGRMDLSETITIPDIESTEDLSAQAAAMDASTLPAGGVEFFQALLSTRLAVRDAPTDVELPTAPTLFVCGSLQAWKEARAAQCHKYEIPVLLIPAEFHSTESPSRDSIEQWSMLMCEAMDTGGSLLVAIGDSINSKSPAVNPSIILERFAQSVAQTVRKAAITTLCLEGGATAAAVLNALGWTRFVASASPALPGVAALRPAAGRKPILLIKPGSYPWPEQLWIQRAGRNGAQ